MNEFFAFMMSMIFFVAPIYIVIHFIIKYW
jgi:hypothetical protein